MWGDVEPAAQKVQNGTRGDKVLIAELTAIRYTFGATGTLRAHH
jgi:hypothetical protein